MIRSVSQVSGTLGRATLGNPSGSLPISPTVCTETPKPMLIALSTRIATSGDGKALVSRGNR